MLGALPGTVNQALRLRRPKPISLRRRGNFRGALPPPIAARQENARSQPPLLAAGSLAIARRLARLYVACGRAVELDLDLLFQAIVILLQHRDHFGLGELRRHRLTLAHELAQQRP